jgi:hypothetical protein
LIGAFGPSVACSTGSRANVCSLDSVPIEYVGGALGDGTLSLTPADDGFRLEIVLFDDTAGVAMRLQGLASCEDGVVRAQLESVPASSGTSDYRVLGGELMYLIEPTQRLQPFGSWEVLAENTVTAETREFRGFVRARKAKQ